MRGTKTSYPLPAEKRKQLPSAPGIYRFVRPNGDVLYVGKAINIKKRIAGHFVSPKRKDERALEMLSQVTDIVVTTTESALEAALLEFDEIKRIDPPYNVQLRGDDERAWFATRDLLSAQPTPDDEHPIGPLPSHWSAFGLGTIRALGRGELDSERPDVRARAVSVPNAFAPDHRTFAEGWNMFVLGLARGERAPDREEEAPPAEWDPAQVHRHLDRSYWGGRLVVRRARWLQLLAESTVTYREADDVRRLTIVVPDRLGAGAWDRARYDRVRILATELMRVNAEGGDVVVEVRGHRVTRKR